MLKLIFLFILHTSLLWAQSRSNDFSSTTNTQGSLSTQDIRSRFELMGEVFVLDTKGRLLYQISEKRIWKFSSKGNIESNWSLSSNGIKDIALRHVWSITEDGKITAHLQQFENMKRNEKTKEVVFGKPLRETSIELKDFEAISWIAQSDSDKKVVMRLTPKLNEKQELISLNKVPMTLNNPIIFDNKGQLWAEALNVEGLFVSYTTHRGMIALSFTPFKGAKEIGFAQGSKIELAGADKLEVYIRSESPIVTTSNLVKVYGIIDLSKKTERVQITNSSSSSEESRFLERVK